MGFSGPFWLNLVLFALALGGFLGLPPLFGMGAIAIIHAFWVILTRK